MEEKNLGWICLHRKIEKNPIVMKDTDHYAMWVHLLINATHAGYDVMFKGKKITLKPGQLITGRLAIANHLGINDSKVYRILQEFKKDGMILIETSNSNSLVTIVNWDKYQKFEQPSVNLKENQPENDQKVTGK